MERPRKILKKEIAAAVEIHPGTLSRWIDEGLRLPVWPCLMGECVEAVRRFRTAKSEAGELWMKSGEAA